MDTLYWFRPERGRLTTMLTEQSVWIGYRSAAQAAGLHFDVIAADDIDLVTSPGWARVYVRGELADPQHAVFHNALYTSPVVTGDCWRYLAMFAGIEHAGYCTLTPAELNLITNDKGATLAYLRDLDDGFLPTLTLPTRDFTDLRLRLADAGIGYPVVAKPAGWTSGMGVVHADSEVELLRALRLASAAEVTMVVQPEIDDATDFADIRVYCADRRPVGTLRRVPAVPGAVANIALGGKGELVDVPEELYERSLLIAERLDVPWLGIDFLHAKGRYYLSEVEVDARMSPATLELPGAVEVLERRFRAYRDEFERWRGGTNDAGAKHHSSL
jgi:RimK-like ATP-grasp domain